MKIFYGFILLLLLVPTALAVNQTCINDYTLQINSTHWVGSTEINITSIRNCPYNCTNNECAGSSVEADMSSVWLIYGTGCVLLILGTILGIPFGRIAGTNKDTEKTFNTSMVVKYIFFFVGLFLVYLSLGMARRVGQVYGADTSISNASDTAVMVMMITIILFLLVFIVEFVFSIIKRMVDTNKINKQSQFERRK